GKGLGIRFLRHIERNAVLLFMIPADTQRDVGDEYHILLNELKQYNPQLLDKDRLVAITKSDLLDRELMDELRQNLPDISSVFISSVAQQNLLELKDLIWQKLNKNDRGT
ncbi:MAG: GTPase ObgE, partial [Bacteroidales bacterium]|nr:GTPase ObgE [Bacteroidales bacterium]